MLNAQVSSCSFTCLASLMQLGLCLMSCYCIFRELVINGDLAWCVLSKSILHNEQLSASLIYKVGMNVNRVYVHAVLCACMRTCVRMCCAHNRLVKFVLLSFGALLFPLESVELSGSA